MTYLFVNVEGEVVYVDDGLLPEKSRRILAVLYDQRGIVVRRDELKRAGWPERGRTRRTDNNRLQRRISEIRKVVRKIGSDIQLQPEGYRLLLPSRLSPLDGRREMSRKGTRNRSGRAARNRARH